MPPSDAQLLRQFVEEKSDAAFNEVVQRHARLVYSVALRQLNGDAHLAHDAVQAVFIDLSRKAPRLLGYTSLAGWLHVSARYAASKLVRAERTRERWQLNAAATSEGGERETPVLDWETIGPLVDELVQCLQKGDREALLMRFFDGQAYGEIAATLQISEEAARKRVTRAMEKLRALFQRRGFPTTIGGLAAALETQAAIAIPEGLAPAVAKAALAYPPAAVGAGTWMILMSTKVKLTILAATLGVLAGIGYLGWRPIVTRVMMARAQHEMAPTMIALLKSTDRPISPRAAAPALAAPSPTSPAAFQPLDAFADTDRSTPGGTVGHLYWALMHCQLKEIDDSVVLSDADVATSKSIFDGLSDRAKAVYRTPERMAVAVYGTTAKRAITDFRVDGTTPQANGDVEVKFSIHGTKGLRNYTFQLRSYPDGWKVMPTQMLQTEDQIAFYRTIAAKLADAVNGE